MYSIRSLEDLYCNSKHIKGSYGMLTYYLLHSELLRNTMYLHIHQSAIV